MVCAEQFIRVGIVFLLRKQTRPVFYQSEFHRSICFFARKTRSFRTEAPGLQEQDLLVDGHQCNCFARAVARHHVSAADILELGFFFFALIRCNRTTGMESATRWWIERAGHVTGKDDTRARAL